MMNSKKQSAVQCKRQYFFCFLLLCFSFTASVKAQLNDSLQVNLNSNVFLQGDTISIEVNLANYASIAKTATIQLWIEEIKTGKRWKYRYPLTNGYVSANLKIAGSVNNGLYAFNFLLQKTFFNVTGVVKNAVKDDRQLNYVMISKTKQTLSNAITVDDKNTFNLGHLLFQDSAFIIFSRPRQKNNDLLINIATPLDSAFTALATQTKLITIGRIDSSTVKSGSAGNYSFKPDSTPYKIILPEVTIKTKMKKKADDFERENVSGLFSGNDAIILDGLDSDEIANAPDLYTFLSIKVGGLRLETDNQTGNRSFTWRNQPTEIYINEIKLDPDIPIQINPSDIALIKIFRPGVAVSSGSGAGGAIAVYTKTAEYSKVNNRNYSFYLLGYTGQESTWK